MKLFVLTQSLSFNRCRRKQVVSFTPIRCLNGTPSKQNEYKYLKKMSTCLY